MNRTSYCLIETMNHYQHIWVTIRDQDEIIPKINANFVLYAFEGFEVVFQCRDEGPIRARVRWTRAGGRPLPPGSRDVNGRLEIPNIRVSWSGNVNHSLKQQVSTCFSFEIIIHFLVGALWRIRLRSSRLPTIVCITSNRSFDGGEMWVFICWYSPITLCFLFLMPWHFLFYMPLHLLLNKIARGRFDKSQTFGMRNTFVVTLNFLTDFQINSDHNRHSFPTRKPKKGRRNKNQIWKNIFWFGNLRNLAFLLPGEKSCKSKISLFPPWLYVGSQKAMV